MQFGLFGRTGVKISAVGLGCGGFGGVGSERSLFGQGESQTEAFALMDAAYEAGINYFDTANSYGGGRSEEMVGDWLEQRGHRNEIFLGTKVGTPLGPGPNDGGLSRQHIVAQVEASLGRLRTDRIDLYMGHQVDDQTSLEETLGAFTDLVTSGKVRYAGICNCEAWRLAKACSVSDTHSLIRFEAVQNEFNLLAEGAQRETLALVRDQQLAFIAYSPLAGGVLSGKYLDLESPPAGSRLATRPQPYAHLRSEHVVAQLKAIRKVASGFGMTMAALSYAWVMSTPGVTALLIGPRRPDQLTDALAAAGARLSDAQRTAIGAAITHAEESF